MEEMHLRENIVKVLKYAGCIKNNLQIAGKTIHDRSTVELVCRQQKNIYSVCTIQNLFGHRTRRIKKRESSHHAGDFCMTGAHPLVVTQRNIFCVKVLEKLREVVRQLCQHVVVRLECPDEEICIVFELFVGS